MAPWYQEGDDRDRQNRYRNMEGGVVSVVQDHSRSHGLLDQTDSKLSSMLNEVFDESITSDIVVP